MTAEEARAQSANSLSPEDLALQQEMVQFNAAITMIATQGRKEMTFPAIVEVIPGHTKRVLEALKAQGFRVTLRTLPDSKIEKNREVLHVAWS